MRTLAGIHHWLATNRASFYLMCIVFAVAQIGFHNDFTEGGLFDAGTKLVVGITTAALLQYFKRRFILIRTKTVLPGVFYLLLMTASTAVLSTASLLVALLFLLSLGFLFEAYQQSDSQAKACAAFIALTGGSLIWYPMILLFPLALYGMHRLQSLNLRTFGAALMGFLLVWLCVFCYAVYKNDLSIFLNLLPDWQSLARIRLPRLEIVDYVYIGFLFLTYAFAAAGLFLPQSSEKVKTKSIYSFLITLSAVMFLFFALFAGRDNTWLTIMFVPLSLLYAHFFIQARSRPALIFFLFTVAALLAKPFVAI